MTKVYIQTYGCSMNQADSEAMAGLLKDGGHQVVKKKQNADMVIFNTCTVKDPTQSKFFDELKKTNKTHKVIVAGCIAQAQPHLFNNQTLVGVEQINKIRKAVELTDNNSNVMFLRRSKEERVSIPSIRTNPLVEIIPINKGCTGKCTYCKTKAARGILQSFPERSIVNRARKAVTEGVKEIWLTSQDTGAYGIDINSSLPELIQKVADNPGDFMIRIGMTNPEFVIKYEKQLTKLLQHNKVYTFLHVPIQSGSQNVLDKMIRPYDIEEVYKVLSRMKNCIPELTLSTDIICGFPGETEQDWQQTMNIVKEIDFPIVNISKFYKRPGTRAARMKQLSSKVIKNRSRELTSWLTNRREKAPEKLNVLLNDQNKNQTLGKTRNYRQVVVPGSYELGKWYEISVIQTHPFYYYGKIL